MQTTTGKLRWALVIALVAAVAAGCGSSGGSQGSSGTTAPSGVPLEGTAWALADPGALATGGAGVAVTAKFTAGTVAGTSGCNSYRASYTLDGSRLTIGSDVAVTQMACPPRPTAVERAYLARLPKVERYAISGDTLRLLDGGGTTILRYEVGGGAAALEGSWDVTGIYTGNAIESTAPDTTPTAEFAADRISGDGGCNRFNGPYEVTGDRIRIGPLASTMMACADSAASTQEQQYLAALQLAATYSVTGDRLDLLRSDGGIAVTFVRSSTAG